MKEKSLIEERFFSIEENLKQINENVSKAAITAGRNPNNIKLMAVTKTVEPIYINHAIACGIDLIGENRVQELLGKVDELKLDNCDVHLIGHLQTNKIRQIVGKVSMIQAVDSVRLAEEIGKRSVENELVTDILLEVNIAKEESKFGFHSEQVIEMVHEISEISGIKVRGLMSVPPICDESEKNRHYFSDMHHLFIDICAKKIDNVNINILSLGMSDDYQQAILEGSNLIRLGSAVFGLRKY